MNAIILAVLVMLILAMLRVHVVLSLFVGALAGSTIGVWLLRRLPAPSLPWILIGFTVFVIVSQYLQVPTREGIVSLTPASCALLILVGLCAGILSGLVGVGGGSVIVPGMELAVGAGDLIARGTSLLVMIPTGIAGTVTNLRHGMVDLRVGLIVGASAAATAPAARPTITGREGIRNPRPIVCLTSPEKEVMRTPETRTPRPAPTAFTATASDTTIRDT